MKFFKRTDIFIIIGIIIVSIAAWGIYNHVSAKDRVRAEIYYYSELVQTVELDTGKDRVFSIPQNDKVVFHLYSDGSIAFIESDCPDKVCINAGTLRSSGQFAACLPNGIVMKIVSADGQKSDDTDLVI